MSVKADNSHEREVITLHVYGVDGHPDGAVEIPWSECLKAISALVGVYGFVDPAGAQSLFRAEKKRRRQSRENSG